MVTAQSTSQVLVEFLYYDRFCSSCPSEEIYYKVYIHNSQIVDRIEQDYESKVLVKRIYWVSTEGQEKIELYNLSFADWNTIVVNEEVILKGSDQFVNETYLREVIDFYLSLEHDVAILSVTPASCSILKGEILGINVTVMNKGKQPESFDATVFCNDTVVGTLFVESLEQNTVKVLTFYWNTTEVQEGPYVLSAYVPPVKNEINVDDNDYYFDGIVEVKVPGSVSTVRHDVAVVSVIPSKWYVNNLEQVNITVTVKNIGTETESFTLKVLLNESIIEERSITNLTSDCEVSEVFVVNAVTLTSGDYVIEARIDHLEGEFSLVNNARLCTIKVMQASNTNDMSNLTAISLAFIFGFFETFSPCLIVLLSFVLSYTIGETTRFKEGLLQVIAFGMGFISAALLIGLTAAFLFFSVLPFQNTLIWIACIFAIFFGLRTIGFDITGIFKMENKTKFLIQKLAKKYVFTYMGIIVLGFLFYFLDPCIAPFFFAVIPLLTHVDFTLIVLAFCLGVMLPFIGIGFVAGSISRLARNMYRHKSTIRIISGLILIFYSIYIVAFYLIPQHFKI
jgi:cytochrome c biogenesis protein CcdA